MITLHVEPVRLYETLRYAIIAETNVRQICRFADWRTIDRALAVPHRTDIHSDGDHAIISVRPEYRSEIEQVAATYNLTHAVYR